jgi:hypothetical protein
VNESTETSPAMPMTSKSARGRSKRPRTEKEKTTPEKTDAKTDFTSCEESNEDVLTAMMINVVERKWQLLIGKM